MAQRTIHYLFGELFSKSIEFKDKKRFLLGSVMPDAYADLKDRNITHYKVKGREKQFFNFDGFREEFGELILKDDLYLGYYMHIVEDAFYRNFIYCGRFITPCCEEDVKKLHNDYHILNNYIVTRYGIENILNESVDLSGETVSKIAEFEINGFLGDMKNDFFENTRGETCFITENMLDEFIEKYVPLGIEALKEIKKGKFVLRATDFAYGIKR